MLNLQWMAAPGMTERQLARMVHDQHLNQSRPAEPTPRNLFEPMPEWTGISGGWKPVGTGTGRKWAMGLAAALPAVLVWLWFRPRTRQALVMDGRRPADFGKLLEPVAALVGFGDDSGLRSRLPIGH